jgi:hypothetical protein
MKRMRHLLADRLTSGTIVVLTVYVLLLSAFFGSLASTAVAAEGRGFVICSALDAATQLPSDPTPKSSQAHDCCVLSCQFGTIAAATVPTAVPFVPGAYSTRVIHRDQPAALQSSGPRRLAQPRAPPSLSA